MTTKRFEFDQIEFAKYNPRVALRPSDPEYQAIQGSLKEFGLLGGLVVNTKTSPPTLVAGHQRVTILRDMGHSGADFATVSLNSRDEKRLNLIMNKVTGRWSTPDLSTILRELQAEQIDLTSLGFHNPTELQALLTGPEKKTFRDPDDAPTAPDDSKAHTKSGDVYDLRTENCHHRLMCGSSTEPKDMAKLCGDRLAQICFTDPPYGVSYRGAAQNQGSKDLIANDNLRDADLEEFVAAALRNVHVHTKPDAALYCFYASRNHIQFENAALTAGWRVKQVLNWVKGMVLGRSDYHWAHEPCQPAGTMVRKVVDARATAKGRRGAFATMEEVPIETLQDGDTVVSYEPRGCVVHTRGRKIKIAQRKYYGDMIEITADGKRTRATDAHKFTIRLDESKASSQIVYLMRKGNWWRIGQVRLFNSRGFGLASRLADEGGDEAWILQTADNALDAIVIEQALSCKYGVPTTHWTCDTYSPNPEMRRTEEHIQRIYQIIGVERIQIGAAQALADHHRSARYPLCKRGEKFAFSRRMSRTVMACNIAPGIMQVPIPTTGEGFKWETVISATYTPFAGTVYSLDVDRDQHYIADGIITHNCLYGAKLGQNCEWFGTRTETTIFDATDDDIEKMSKDQAIALLRDLKAQTTAWEEKKDPPSILQHPNQKPTSLAARALRNSSLPGHHCIEPFGGSGSTLIACELHDRHCLAIELSRGHCDAIIRRFAETFGNVSFRKNGKPFDPAKVHAA